jgi:hypothetical protein
LTAGRNTDLTASLERYSRNFPTNHGNWRWNFGQYSHVITLEFDVWITLEYEPERGFCFACWDNAVAESFFATLKCELDLDKPIGSRAET